MRGKSGGVFLLVLLVLVAVLNLVPENTVVVEADPGPKQVFLPLVLVNHRSPFLGQGVGATYVTDSADCYQLEGLDLFWFYNWTRNPPICPGFESTPMVYSHKELGKPLGGNSEWALFYNEPDVPMQANRTPEQAVDDWFQFKQDNPDRKLVSAAILVHWETTWRGFGWLEEWYDLYTQEHGDPGLSAIAIHCYGSVADCKNAVTEAIALADDWGDDWGVDEVWLTEWALLPCQEGYEAKCLAFMQEMKVWLADQPKLTRYAWFQLAFRGDEDWWVSGGCNSSLRDFFTHEITPLGEQYQW